MIFDSANLTGTLVISIQAWCEFLDAHTNLLEHFHTIFTLKFHTDGTVFFDRINNQKAVCVLNMYQFFLFQLGINCGSLCWHTHAKMFENTWLSYPEYDHLLWVVLLLPFVTEQFIPYYSGVHTLSYANIHFIRYAHGYSSRLYDNNSPSFRKIYHPTITMLYAFASGKSYDNMYFVLMMHHISAQL